MSNSRTIILWLISSSTIVLRITNSTIIIIVISSLYPSWSLSLGARTLLFRLFSVCSNIVRGFGWNRSAIVLASCSLWIILFLVIKIKITMAWLFLFSSSLRFHVILWHDFRHSFRGIIECALRLGYHSCSIWIHWRDILSSFCYLLSWLES